MDRDGKGKFLIGHNNFYKKKYLHCLIEGCTKKPFSKGYCSKHYQRWKKYGNPIEPPHWLGRPNSGKKFNCLICNKEYYRRPSEIKKGMYKYCSKECGYKAHKGKLKK